MQDKVEAITQGSAGLAVVSFFSMAWWNDNSAGIVAICAVIGATVSVSSFLYNQWRKGLFKRK